MKVNSIVTPVNVEERKNLAMSSGDTVKVWQKIKEKDKFRLQAFEGIVLARKHGTQSGATFTVRRVIDGVGVEKIFPLYSPMIDKIEVIKRSRVRRSKLYFVRKKAIKEIKKQLSKTLKEKEIPTAQVSVGENITKEEVKTETKE